MSEVCSTCTSCHLWLSLPEFLTTHYLANGPCCLHALSPCHQLHCCLLLLLASARNLSLHFVLFFTILILTSKVKCNIWTAFVCVIRHEREFVTLQVHMILNHMKAPFEQRWQVDKSATITTYRRSSLCKNPILCRYVKQKLPPPLSNVHVSCLILFSNSLKNKSSLLRGGHDVTIHFSRRNDVRVWCRCVHKSKVLVECPSDVTLRVVCG